MDIITINSQNIDKEHICCAIGNDATNKRRAETKKAWLKERFSEGLIFKRLDSRGKCFIEYIPIEKVWKPVIGTNIMMINCLWVSGQFKGHGYSKLLLQECERDAAEMGMDGIAVVTSNKTKAFLTDKKFYVKQGFELADTAHPYFELLLKKLNNNCSHPKFTDYAKAGECDFAQGLKIVYAHQCPFMEEYTKVMSVLAQQKGIPTQVILLDSAERAQCESGPFGTLTVYLDGKFLTHELMTEKKFSALLEKQV